jgi:hypothetical protein
MGTMRPVWTPPPASSLSTFSYWGDDIMSWRDPYASGSTVP